ncbi:MAG: glutathione peroxidase [Chitinophagaceae bacterium]|nr:glutathione peroxidase [Chitinophagaceae bacterium]
MTYRQKVLKAVYPAWMWFARLTGKNTKELSGNKQPAVSFYSLKAILNNGDTLDFATLKGKKVLLVNTASNCGYTDQYDDLQKLSDRYKDKLTVIGFPANDFKEQEKGTDEEIAQFCKVNYGITFPLVKKNTVIRSADQHPVFQWLTDSSKNGWNNEPPSWNFTKYLVNEEGKLTNYFGPSVSPVSKDILEAIRK